ncbi:MAG: acyltransferase [Acidobacteria bacterium]|jgi:D-alanyl-lipoteichoic acid acyltransferase DltB (MBOAT superfamily)|nr:acyltransferase [Acidobacteriota bacterium]MDP7480955.1 MBOAT family O-acyltransferase [Vicinamibacterales bacterium]HJN43750.1 MBOAT family O-acyltransferase [Vicinamibacterales bacterium]|tara:strand:+ start:825 stop:2276 length:1452 start_codon:yes stop_codon:yes gene_type:complete
MLFNSFSFLGCFAALAVLYYAVPHRFRWPLLLATSLIFYATFSAAYLVLLLVITLVTYRAGLALGATADPRRTRVLLATSVAAVLGALVVFKYYDFLAGTLEGGLATVGAGGSGPLFPRLGLVVAAGLSFYTFSCVSYLVDVSAGRLPPERHLGHFALYVAFFPKLLAGPIERARPFLTQLLQPVSFSADGVTQGLQLMLWGLFKKVVLADRLAIFVDTAYGQAAFSSPADLVLATYFFAFQLYCDFSGYSDMAIGAAKVLGIDLMENFRRPYFSTSVPEFWTRRWHLSLAGWFRDYLYVPLGGSRRSRLRLYANVLAVFLVSGLWHGASWTFVVWGGLNGLYQVCSLATRGMRERVCAAVRLPGGLGGLLRGLLTFHLILVTWIFFRAASLADATTIVSRVTASLATLPRLLQVRIANPEILFSIGLIAVLLCVEAFDERRSVWERLADRPVYLRWGVYYAVLGSLIVLGTWNLQQFVYMGF